MGQLARSIYLGKGCYDELGGADEKEKCLWANEFHSCSQSKLDFIA